MLTMKRVPEAQRQERLEIVLSNPAESQKFPRMSPTCVSAIESSKIDR